MKEKDANIRLAEENAEVSRLNKRLQRLHHQMENELQLAQRIRASLLPQKLPEVSQARFAVHYLPSNRAGGDFYDVVRVDENQVGLYVADVMGHGILATLLTVLVKYAVQAKEVLGHDHRLLPPEEVLQRINQQLLDLDLSEHPFLTMGYALYNQRNGVFCFARAGHPHPLYIPRTGELILWRQEGLFLGVTETSFPARSYPLNPGDKVLLYSDGIDGGRFGDHAAGADSLLGCAKCHRHLPIQKFLDGLSRELFASGERHDDVTLLGLEVL